MEDASTSEKSPLFAELKPMQLLQVALIGVFVGLLTWGLSYALGLYVLRPSSCIGVAITCVASYQPATILASIIAACIGLFGLVKLQIFRPLLVVIAATASLWLLVAMLNFMPWYSVLGVTVFFYAVAYTTFAWIARVRPFWLAVLIDVLLVVAVRLILTA